MRVSALVPAFNEATSVTSVLRTLQESKDIAEIIVIDDGSTDGTAMHVKKQFPEIKLIEIKPNQGKGHALSVGAQIAQGDILLFCDADLTGLTPQHIDQLLTPIREEKARLVCGIQEYLNPFTTSKQKQKATPIGKFLQGLGGEKVLWKKDFQAISPLHHAGYEIEQAIIDYYEKNHLLVSYCTLSGVGHIHKVQKWGLATGMKKEIQAYAIFIIQFIQKQLKTFINI